MLPFFAKEREKRKIEGETVTKYILEDMPQYKANPRSYTILSDGKLTQEEHLCGDF